MRHLVFLLFVFYGFAPAGDPSFKELQARERFQEIQTHHTRLEVDQVRAKMKALAEDFPEVKGLPAFTKLAAEVAHIGKEAGTLEVEQWYQGETTLAGANVTLLVFWESWCPHCQDEMPKIQKLFEQYQERGLNVIGLTKITQSATMTSVLAFIGERDLTFSVGKENGSMSKYYGVEGIPAAAIVKNGIIIWRGNPERISNLTIEKALANE